jgi:hypothetical protein
LVYDEIYDSLSLPEDKESYSSVSKFTILYMKKVSGNLEPYLSNYDYNTIKNGYVLFM